MTLAQAREIHAALCAAVDEMDAGSAATAALMAAVDFHSPVPAEMKPAGCKTCITVSDFSLVDDPAAYPCDEVVAIASALGVATVPPPVTAVVPLDPADHARLAAAGVPVVEPPTGQE